MDAIELKKKLEAANAAGGGEAIIAMMRDAQDEQVARDASTARMIFLGFAIGLLGLGAWLLKDGLGPVLSGGEANVEVAAPGGVLMLLGAFLGFLGVRVSPPPRELETTGIPAKARVVDYRSAFGSFGVGSERERNQRSLTRVEIDLEVSPESGEAYTTTIQQHLGAHQLSALTVGAQLAAFVDRTRRDRILLRLGR